jgi:ketosteroid isomerase-like protein
MSSSKPGDYERASNEIDNLYQQFSEAYDSLDIDKVTNLYADSAFYLMPNPQAPVLKGQSSIRESFASYINGSADENRHIEIDFRIINRTISDSLAYDVGYYRTRSKPDTAASFQNVGSVGKFVTVIGLMPDGSWKFLLDGYNTAPPEAFSEAESDHNPMASN